MRIVLISTLFSPYSRGGAERVAEMTSRGLRDAGHEVSVITAGPKDGYGPEPKMEERDGMRVYRFYPPNLFFYGDMNREPVVRRLMFHLRDAMNPASASVVREILRKEKPDAVITENIKGIGFLVPRTIRALGVRHIHVLHDVQLIEPSGLVCIPRQFHRIAYETVGKSAVRRVWAAWMRRLWGSPDVVCPSRWIADVHRAWGFFPKSMIEVVQNPVEACNAERLTLNVGNRLLFVGQIEEHKGVFDLIRAVRMVKTDAVVDVVGEGSARRELFRMTAGNPRFVFHGRVEPDQLPEFYAGAAATVYPSRCLENAPAAISESLACGTPVIASRIGGIPEMIRGGENGRLVPPGDVAALAGAIEQALTQKNDLAIRNRCRASVAGRSVGEYVQKISALVRSPGDPLRV